MAKEPSITLTFRAPKSMVVELDHMAGELGGDRSECIRDAITQYLDAGTNSLKSRVSRIEQRLASMGHEIGQVFPENVSAGSPSGNEGQVAELETKLALAEAEVIESRSAIETMEGLINQGGGSVELSRWLVRFRRDHPPK